MKRYWLFIVLLLMVGWLFADVKLEGKKILTHKESEGGKQYGIMLQLDMDDIESWAMQQVAAGVKEYASVRFEIKRNGKWLIKEYSVNQFVDTLDLEPLVIQQRCCDEIKAVQTGETWNYCPFCQKKLDKNP